MNTDKKVTSTLRGNGTLEVFCKYIVKNGKRIYPKKATCFHFIVKRKK